MNYAGITVLLILFLFAALQWRAARLSKRSEGQAVPVLQPDMEAKLHQRGKALFYFFSASCGPCRTMTPRIDAAASRHDNVFKVDVGASADLAQRFGVRATPTTVLVAGGRIARIELGPLSEKTIAELLA
jgi:thioredoxin-like negative regulator of GroEL